MLCRRASSSPTRLSKAHDTFAHPTQLILTARDRLRSTPEQLRAAELVQLAERVADLVQQAVLVALGRESLQLRIECAQLAHQGIDRLPATCRAPR